VKCWWWHAGIDLTPTSIKKMPCFSDTLASCQHLYSTLDVKKEGKDTIKETVKKRGIIDKWQILGNQ
jgi:hypothetical protein